MQSDPIADYLTRIRNALGAKHRTVDIPSSLLKRRISEVLKDKGFIRDYRVIEDDKQGILQLSLKYERKSKKSVVVHMSRVSKPSLRRYVGSKELPRVLNGLGIAVLSTSHGVMSDKEARKQGIGGEVLCYVY